MLRIQQQVLTSVREYLSGQGFIELLAPVIGPVTDPGTRGGKQVDIDFYGHRYKLMTSAILYKQTTLLAFDKIFFIAPNVRLEPLETSTSGRHLVEFHQIDVEVANASRDEILDLGENLVKHVVRRSLESMGNELTLLGRDQSSLADIPARPFERMAHADAVRRLHAAGTSQNPDAEIGWEAEVLLSLQHQQPFFVTDYPKGSRGFYDRESTDEPGSLRNFDLIMPEGYGELCSGSERESDYATLVTRMRETGENPAKYAWYLQTAREGLPPSAGFGIGLERFTRYLAGLSSITEASAFPKIAGVPSP